MGIIVRTAGSNKTKNEINDDLKNLISSWEKIKENALNSIAPSLIHQESDIIKRSLRDMFDDNTQNIIVEGNDGYQRTKNYVKQMLPKHLKKVKKASKILDMLIKEFKFSEAKGFNKYDVWTNILNKNLLTNDMLCLCYLIYFQCLNQYLNIPA